MIGLGLIQLMAHLESHCTFISAAALALTGRFVVMSSGILKDYLRELPSPLITKTLYHVVMEAMTLRPPPATPDPLLAQSTVALLDCLPPPEKVTPNTRLQHFLMCCFT